MDKVLKFYKIPEAGSITNVTGLGTSLPQSPNEGDLFIVTSPLALFEAIEVSSGGVTTVSWFPKQMTANTYYRDLSKDEPTYWLYNGTALSQYDTSFPATGRTIETYEFTYSASRMGSAPSITTTIRDFRCLDSLWTDRVCTFFNGTFFFLKNKPASKKSNEDERYEHSVELLSERTLLENTYLANIADYAAWQSDPVALQYDFSVFGGISQVVTLINETLKFERLHKNGIGFSVQIAQDQTTQDFISNLEEPEQMFEVSDMTIKEALDEICDKWGVPYYFVGYDIYIGFSNEPQVSEAGFTMPTIEYGISNEALSISKSQKNDVKNRITGVGSDQNLPYFYPNETPGGLYPVYERSGQDIDDAVKVINPYRMVNITETENTTPTPDGTYYIFGPVNKTHVFDQTESINQTTTFVVEGLDLARQPRLSDETRTRLYVQVDTSTGVRTIIKEVWVWFEQGTTSSVAFQEKNRDIETEQDISPFGSFAGKANCYLINATYSQWEQMSIGNSSYTALTGSVSLNYVTGANSISWSDSTTTDNFWAKFPITVSSVPANATCAVLQTQMKVYEPYFNIIADTWRAKARHIYYSVVTQHYVGSADWTNGSDGTIVSLFLKGLRVQNVTPHNGDIIYYKKDAALDFAGHLLPYNFRLSNDVWLNALNSTYLKQNSQSLYYTFENLYKYSCAKETIEDHEDIHPTIKGMRNGDTPSKRMDMFLDVAFDADDNNEVRSDGEYVHSYFYVKLPRTNKTGGYGFNLFDRALPSSVMQVSMTSGDCGGCTFDIMVKYADGYVARNPVRVFTQATTINGVTYAAGTPERDENGNVKLTEAYQDIQQDTESNEVWICLKKDNSTFSPSTFPDTANSLLPTALQDTFVLLNIDLPMAYVVDAEQRLYYALLDSLEEQNRRQYSFSIRFSSIYYANNFTFMDEWLNEASKVPFVYNSENLEYYVSSYTYRMTSASSLPEVTIDLDEKVKPRVPFRFPSSDGRQQRIEVQVPATQQRSLNVGNLHVDGDITLYDGTSVNAQIYDTNARLFETSRQVNSREEMWGVVSSRAEAENLFIDGTFAYGLASHTDSSATTSVNSYGLYGIRSLHCEIESLGTVYFSQQIPASDGLPYSAVFNSRTTSGSSEQFRVEMRFHDSVQDKFTTYYNDFSAGTSWERNIMTYTAPENTDYMLVRFGNTGNGTINIDIDGLMVFEDDFSDVSASGSFTPNALCPSRYVQSMREVLLSSSSGSAVNLFICTLTSSGNPCTMDKTTTEIVQAVSNGKEVVCVDLYNSKTYILADISSSQIHFGIIYSNITYNLYANIGVESWWKFNYRLQPLLYDSGANQNIKTINNQSLLGSGNISVGGGSVLVCTYSNGSMDKTPQEIYNAFSSNILTIAKYGDSTFVCTVASETSGIIEFTKISNPSDNNNVGESYIKYFNNSWTIATKNLQLKLIGSGTGQNIKTINGNSVLGSGNLETEDWQTIVADDGDTGTTITPTTDYTVIFIDNSANSSDYTVAFDTTGVDTVFEEYDSLVVENGSISRFDIRKFTTDNVVYASVKRTNLQNAEPSYYGVTSFRADNVLRVMGRCGFAYVEQYRQALETLPTGFPRPSIYTKTGTTTFNNETYYVYSLQDWAYDHYDTIVDFIVLIPSDFAFKTSQTIENCGENPTTTYLQYYYLTANLMEIYKGNSNAPTLDIRNVIDFVP